MARKTRTSRKAQESNDSTRADTADAVENAAEGTKPESESNLTDDVSEASDTRPDAETETSGSDEAGASSDKSGTETAEGAAGADDVAENSGEAETPVEGEKSDPVDADPVETNVAGVVPAQAEEPIPSPVPPPPAATPSTLPLVFGGLLAGAAGFLVATFAVPEGWPNPPSEAPAVVEVPTPDPETIARVDALTSEVTALSERIDNLPESPGDVVAADPVDLSPLLERLDAIEGDTGGLRTALTALEESASALSVRVDEIANRPSIVAPDGSAAMEAQLETFRRDLDAVTEAARAEIADAQARTSQIEAEAAAAAAEAARNAAMAEVRAALESGEPFADSLGALGDVPEALSSVAADGVRPMAALQDAFPDAARIALQEVQTVPEDASPTDRVASFLRRHTNARSLAPREGEDADAVLSRAEAALASGDIAAALTELDALPDTASAALQAWIDDARARAAAVAAMNEME